MTPKLTQIFALFRPCCKTDARCGWLPAARAARTMVEQQIAGDSRRVMRCLLIVSASERQQIAALATQEFLSRADIWRTAAKQYVEARETRAVSHAHES
jgi:hypothetical protein